ncbi:LapA family protein [Pseudoclavibacter terrae]|uniref:Uncharacterized protein n=1 Tax=Pseudoclavibacter terrae TaxID=1530195 RepID=A0A7J5B1X6_9MICO|nr:hypothetical protein [Pseudoclavibacter terrae]KAB1637862.1 hypothetical protein F8O03_11795 [Pseudoclavibacter terrae]
MSSATRRSPRHTPPHTPHRRVRHVGLAIIAALLGAAVFFWGAVQAQAVEVASGAAEQSVPRAAVVTIAVLSGVIVVLLVAFVVWMRRHARSERDEVDEPGGGAARSD